MADDPKDPRQMPRPAEEPIPIASPGQPGTVSQAEWPGTDKVGEAPTGPAATDVPADTDGPYPIRTPVDLEGGMDDSRSVE
jgi:hypothetical protein